MGEPNPPSSGSRLTQATARIQLVFSVRSRVATCLARGYAPERCVFARSADDLSNPARRVVRPAADLGRPVNSLRIRARIRDSSRAKNPLAVLPVTDRCAQYRENMRENGRRSDAWRHYRDSVRAAHLRRNDQVPVRGIGRLFRPPWSPCWAYQFRPSRRPAMRQSRRFNP